MKTVREKMTKQERVLAAFKHQPTDRVPLYDLMMNDDCIEFFTGAYPTCDQAGAALHAKAVDCMLDMARGVGAAPLAMPPDFFTDNPRLRYYARYSSLGGHRPFVTYEDAVTHAKERTRQLRKWRENTDLKAIAEKKRSEFAWLYSQMSEDHVVCCLHWSGTGLDEIRAEIGIEFYSYLSADEPELVSEFLELSTEREVAIIHAIADPAIAIWALTYGDIAAKRALLHSPAWLRREFIPRLKRLNDAYHEHGIYCLFHSDGYLMEIMPDLIAAGSDGINPIETVAGMDVGEVYRLYGKQIFLTGGIDMSQLLANGTPAQVRAECRKAIAAAPTGYLMGSTTEIDNSSRLENVLAMVETSWGFAPQGAKPDILEQIHQRRESMALP